jgi:hypothetical protein
MVVLAMGERWRRLDDGIPGFGVLISPPKPALGHGGFQEIRKILVSLVPYRLRDDAGSRDGRGTVADGSAAAHDVVVLPVAMTTTVIRMIPSFVFVVQPILGMNHSIGGQKEATATRAEAIW